MSFKLKWTETAVKSLKKFDKKDVERIVKKVEKIKENPFRFIKKLKSLPFYSLRIGNFRVLMIIDFSNSVIFVIEVEHRKRIYKRLR